MNLENSSSVCSLNTRQFTTDKELHYEPRSATANEGGIIMKQKKANVYKFRYPLQTAVNMSCRAILIVTAKL